MKNEDEEIAILVCGYPRPEGYPFEGVEEHECADCGCDIVRRPDPEVPEDAIKLCFECADKRIGKEIEESGEPPTVRITKQNKGLLERLGAETFTCAACHGTFIKDRDDQEALDEFHATYPGATLEGATILCGDCHDKFVAWEAGETRQ